MSNKYDNMKEYITSVFHVFQSIQASSNTNQRSKMISLVILNYVKYMAKEYNVNLTDIVKPERIHLMPIFEYIAANQIALIDFSSININDIDVTKKEDIERFVVSHIYYITQQ
jgi:hypothetical protein